MNAQQNQLDCVTESKRGGKRDHAGAKLKHGEPTAVIRLPVSMIEKIKKGEIENVTSSNNSSGYSCIAENCYQCMNWDSESEQCGEGLTPGIICNGFYSIREEIAELKESVRIGDRQYLEALEKIEHLESALYDANTKVNDLTTKLKKVDLCQHIDFDGAACEKPATRNARFGTKTGHTFRLCTKHAKEMSKP